VRRYEVEGERIKTLQGGSPGLVSAREERIAKDRIPEPQRLNACRGWRLVPARGERIARGRRTEDRPTEHQMVRR
jgi:hypothetical protein